VKTGVQFFYNPLKSLDSGFHRNDDSWAFLTFDEVVIFYSCQKIVPPFQIDVCLEKVLGTTDGSLQVLQGVASGKAQIGRPGPRPLLAARSRALDVVFIYNLYPKSIFGLVVKKDGRIR